MTRIPDDMHSVDCNPYPGMPKLKPVRRVTSYFEFWPTFIVYLPVALLWILLALRYRSLTLPLLVNRKIPLGGMVGESKGQILSLAGDYAQQFIAPFILHLRDDRPLADHITEIELALVSRGIHYPFVAKPDKGCRGAGVQKINDQAALVAYLNDFPLGQTLMCQRLCSWQPEAGVFYLRDTDGVGKIVSLTLKYPAIVIGDGRRSIDQLIKEDSRASKLYEVYLNRLIDRRDEVVACGQTVELSFAGNHCRGALFRNGNEWITAEMTAALDSVLRDVQDFQYGRLDIRFSDIEIFRQGKGFEIIEINGVSSEAAHIWDPETSLAELFRVLFWQYRTLFRLGARLRLDGHRPPSLWCLWQSWREHADLADRYPATH